MVSRRFMPWPTRVVQMGTLDIKNLCLRFLRKYNMNQLRSKIIFIPFALRTRTMQNLQSPVGKKYLPAIRVLSFLRSRVKLGLSLDSANKFLHTHVEAPKRTA